jgi:hypothetical protein
MRTRSYTQIARVISSKSKSSPPAFTFCLFLSIEGPPYYADSSSLGAVSLALHESSLLYHVYTTEPEDTCSNSTVSAHCFSEDGFRWHSHPASPYGTHIQVAGGADVIVSTRERPKLFFDRSGQMTHLFNGVCAAPACAGQAPCVNCKVFYWDYTLVAPLDV